jgi:hypothetical protein
MTIQITQPELEELIKKHLETGQFEDAEDVILSALRSSGNHITWIDEKRAEGIERLRTFGKTHGLSLDGLTIGELRREARP